MGQTNETELLEAFAEGFREVLKRNPGAGPRFKLKLARRALGLSQREFAVTFGLSYASVRNWELADKGEPSGAAKVLIDILAEDPSTVRALALRASQRAVEIDHEEV